MNREMISSRLDGITADLETLRCHLRAIDSLDIQRFPKTYKDMLEQGSLLAEKLTCKLRSLIYASAEIPKQVYLEKAAAEFEVELQYEDDVFSIVLPCLLPRKSGKFTSLFLMEPVNAALEQYAATQPLPKFKECCVCIIHEYQQNPSGNRVFDYDNLEQKQLLDTIAMHILTDDNASLCDVFHSAQVGERDCTKVFVMPQTSFPAWLLRRTLDKFPISDFP